MGPDPERTDARTPTTPIKDAAAAVAHGTVFVTLIEEHP